jgi:hypothetical protein
VKKKSRRFPKEQTFHHNVYVILLSEAVAKHPSILRLNPNRDPLKPYVYVGMTGIPVDHRFENHKNSYKPGLGRQEIWRAIDAGALRTLEPDGV